LKRLFIEEESAREWKSKSERRQNVKAMKRKRKKKNAKAALAKEAAKD
jgi:hypothetical protein